MPKETSEHNGYTYTVDTETGTTTGSGHIVDETAARNSYAQRTAGHDDRITGNSDVHENDEGGHLIAAAENGTSDSVNLSAQNYDVNRGSYRSIEKAEIDEVRAGNDVYTEKTAVTREGVERPDAYIVNDTVTRSDGTQYTVHESMTNISNNEHERMDSYEERTMDPEDYTGDRSEVYDHGLTEDEIESYMSYSETYGDQFGDDVIGVSFSDAFIDATSDTSDAVGGMDAGDTTGDTADASDTGDSADASDAGDSSDAGDDGGDCGL